MVALFVVLPLNIHVFVEHVILKNVKIVANLLIHIQDQDFVMIVFSNEKIDKENEIEKNNSKINKI